MFPNYPNNIEERKRFENPVNQFGALKFNDVVLQFKPHVVVDVRDPWMFFYQFESPFRKYFKHLIMPTVDSYPQSIDWLNMYSTADAVFTYTDWGATELIEESKGRIKCAGSAPPAPSTEFQKLEQRHSIKKMFGLQDFKIIGTIMRNHKRKLYPELFKVFRKVIEETNNQNVLLYCHTSYPDLGWELPELLLKEGIQNRVLFTYVCKMCGQSFPNFVSDAVTECIKCGNYSATMSNTKNGVSKDILNKIVNMFDYYIQYCTNEGFGIPVVEAAAAGVPVFGTDFPPFSEVVQKCGGTLLPCAASYLELETGVYRGVPDNDKACKILSDALSWNTERYEVESKKTYETCHANYSWDKTSEKYAAYFDSLNVEECEKKWLAAPNYFNSVSEIPNHLSNEQFVEYCIINILGDPTYLNGPYHLKWARDLNRKGRPKRVGGNFYVDESFIFDKANYENYTREMLVQECLNMRNTINYWEQKRCGNG